MFCPSCGANNVSAAASCNECGTPLPKTTTTPAPAPAEAPRILRRPGPLAPPSLDAVPRAVAPPPPPPPTPELSVPAGLMPPPMMPTVKPPPTSAFAEVTDPVAAVAALPTSDRAEVTAPVRAVPGPPPPPVTPILPPPIVVAAPAPAPPPAPAPAPAPAPVVAAVPKPHPAAPPRVAAPPPPEKSAAPVPTTTTTTTATTTRARPPARAPAAPVTRLQIVTFPRQWAAAAVDAAGAFLFVAGAVRLALSALDLRATTQAVVEVVHADPLSLIPVVVAGAAGLLLWHLLPLLLSASPGQRLLQLTLVDKAGGKPARARLVLRAVVAAVSTLCFFAGPAWGLFVDQQRRAFADVVAGTVAVRR
ncbi:MAG: RDD family protein [Deltaproteobacteria bacterium]|nr:RDD family protein [Deltaproteobacteria bacterium]